MIYGLWLSTAGLQVNEYRQSVIANNIANADTAGFKRDLAIVRQRDVESRINGQGMPFAHPILDGLSGGSFVRPTHTVFEEGPLTESSNPLDLAIEGDGFFAVQTADGTRYTRDGRFVRGQDGTLQTVGGHALLDDAGATIQLNAKAPAGSIRVSEDGSIYQGDSLAGRLSVKGFEDRSLLQKTGEGLFVNLGSKETDATGRVRSGAIEQSNTVAVNGMVDMIEATRAYQLNASLIQMQDEMLRRAVNDVGRIG